MPDFAEMRRIMEKQHVLSVAEMFGPTVQGEGRNQGAQAYFIRLGLCNLDCKWCDTPYTWDWTGKNGYKYSKTIELRRMDIYEMLQHVPRNCERIVITGGEPMVQQSNLIELVYLLRSLGHVVEIETNGTIEPSNSWLELAAHYSDNGVQFNVSPKLRNSGVARDKAIHVGVLNEFNYLDAIFKFVVQTEDCIDEIKDIQQTVGIEAKDIYLMPEGRNANEIMSRLPWLFEVCSQTGYNLTPRLHVLAWNDRRKI